MMAVTLLLAGACSAPLLAITAADQDSAIVAYNRAFWNAGRKLFTITNTDTTPEKFWTAANEWQMLMDAYERTGDTRYLTQVNDFYTGFVNYWATRTEPRFTKDWWTITTDSDNHAGVGNFNDDMMWAAMSCVRAYTLTGKNEHRNQGKAVFDQVWARALDTLYGGGLYWNSNLGGSYKSACINYPAIITAVYLSDAFGDSTYLSKALELYAWCRNVLFNTSTGAVYDGRGAGGVSKAVYTYNQGCMIGAAHLLYKKTNDEQYYQEALLAAEYARKSLCVAGTDVLKNENNGYNEPGFKGIFVLYLARFAREYSLSAYTSWLQHMAATVYNHRQKNTGLTNANFGEFAADTSLYAWASYSGCNLLQVITPDDAMVNLSYRKSATSNGASSGGSAEKAVDGVIPNSAWQGNAAGEKWIRVELGENCTISRYEVQHAGAGGDSAVYNTRSFKLQRSSNGSDWFDVDVVTANTAGRTIKDVTPFAARYVRLLITQAGQSGNEQARIYEFVLFGADGNETRARVALTSERSRIELRQSANIHRIAFTVASRGADIQLAIYDLHGRCVRTLIDRPLSAGRHAVIFDHRDDAGKHLAAGRYVCRLSGEAGVWNRALRIMPGF